MSKSASAGEIIQGKIDSGAIYNAHRLIRDLVTDCRNISNEVETNAKTIMDNWVGKGKTEFKSQYEYLISKIGDFTEALEDIYNGLVTAEADYETVDRNLGQDFWAAEEKGR